MATRQHLTDRANQAGACFVLNEYSDDPDASAYLVGQNVPLPTETTEQICATEADHRTGWNKTFKSGTYRGMLYGVVFARLSETSCTIGQCKERFCEHA